ncbi:2-phosphosulfolactate phosphatase [Nocardioides yefusunii]|uniref:Probable 2-phosphosulfolactate phosphatase n=1 Tax=Nocardioides yefusunii TaxID=2500546 RepID=A0ABW1R0W3_9ACTN|nr:2-phosphosulfolactate phosphatase [Nocardioides yefusunii]
METPLGPGRSAVPSPGDPAHTQSGHRVRFEWGGQGAATVKADVAVVVDVLSFTTSLTVAVERGIEVFPFEWRDSRGTEHALRHGASLAVSRIEAKADARHVSISPTAINQMEGIERLVLTSPTGAKVAFSLIDSKTKVVAASLRNADAVADHVVRVADALGRKRSVVVIAAGEQWPDGTLRPGVEDLWGAGAVIAGLVERGLDDLSVEARTALAAYLGVEDGIPDAMHQSVSGKELIERGFSVDVDLAAQVNVSTVVPVLRGESFVQAPQY